MFPLCTVKIRGGCNIHLLITSAKWGKRLINLKFPDFGLVAELSFLPSDFPTAQYGNFVWQQMLNFLHMHGISNNLTWNRKHIHATNQDLFRLPLHLVLSWMAFKSEVMHKFNVYVQNNLDQPKEFMYVRNYLTYLAIHTLPKIEKKNLICKISYLPSSPDSI